MAEFRPESFNLMPPDPSQRDEIDRFIVEEIDSVPQLEALLLFWRSRPKSWTRADLAKSLYVSPDIAQNILKSLQERQLIRGLDEPTGSYALEIDSSERERLFASLEKVYRTELVRISNMIHTKASRALRDFAHAFRFRKD